MISQPFAQRVELSDIGRSGFASRLPGQIWEMAGQFTIQNW
jgi:hypothetical protein